MAADKVLLVVGIIEGRKFPKRAGFKVLVEAKFDGEILSTDPVEHNESPNFTTELAWESDKKSLHQHRLQRTPIKLQCFAVDMNNKRKEPVGYCILDIRSAQMNDTSQKPVWFGLLNSKYYRLKPELRVILSLEDGSLKVSSSVEPGNVTSSTEEGENQLIPILDETEGHYLIGEKSKATHIYCLSVTIAAGKNLAKVIPSDIEIRQQDRFYFFYKLLGNDVTSEPFLDVINPNFAAERASVRILSSMATMKMFFQKNPSLQFHFCSGDASLASTSISLLPILKDDVTANTPSKIEGLFPLTPSRSSPPAQPPRQPQALLGISIVFKIEAEYNAVVGQTGMSPVLAGGGDAFRPERPLSPSPKEEGSSKSTPTSSDQHKSDSKPSKEKKVGKKASRPLKFDDDAENNSSLQENVEEINKQKAEPRKERFKPKPELAAKSKHYCYSVDLRSVKNLDIENPIRCFCRYSYPFFGSSSPILTSPAIEVRKNTEVLLPKSFCAFDFATSEEMLLQTLKRIPLLVEVWHRDPSRKDALLGVSEINLSSVFTAEKVSVQETTYRQIQSQVVHIVSPDSFRRKVGLLHVVLGLEDFGEIKSQQMTSAIGTTQSLISASMTDNTLSETSEDHLRPKPAAQPKPQKERHEKTSSHHEEQPRDLPEYKAAIELELWKEQQEEVFKTMLQEKEKNLMQTLAEEWKKRDKERELIFQRKIDEYNQLEEKMRTMILDLEKREKQVAANEAEVHRLKDDLLREHEQKLSFLREASIRMKEDCEHKIELEKMKLEEVKEQCKRYKEQLQAAEKRFNDKENEIMLVKEQMLDRPENKLQAELNLALLEKTGLERKLDQVTKSKIHYKQQWGKALRELAKMKQNEQMAAKMRLKQQERELEHMRLRYLAAEEKEMIKTDKEVLVSVKEELRRLKESQMTDQTMTLQPQSNIIQDASNQPIQTQKIKVNEPEQDTYTENRIAKLIEERDTLLRTGVYSTDDKIISELDRQIREAIAAKDR